MKGEGPCVVALKLGVELGLLAAVEIKRRRVRCARVTSVLIPDRGDLVEEGERVLLEGTGNIATAKLWKMKGGVSALSRNIKRIIH
jgi:hypothetical protein